MSYESIPRRSDDAPARWRLAMSPVVAGVIVIVVGALATIGILRAVMPTRVDVGDVGVAAAQSQVSVAEEVNAQQRDASESGGAAEGDSSEEEDPAGPEGNTETSGRLVLFVTGAVANPGVVEVAPGARIKDAVDQAGGLLHTADMLSINLAQLARDGDHVHVFEVGETPSPVAGSSSTPSGQGAAAAGCVDLNGASAAELETLDGVGPKIAERIVSYRENNGPFANADALTGVSGIGAGLLARIKPGLCSQ